VHFVGVTKVLTQNDARNEQYNRHHLKSAKLKIT